MLSGLTRKKSVDVTVLGLVCKKSALAACKTLASSFFWESIWCGLVRDAARFRASRLAKTCSKRSIAAASDQAPSLSLGLLSLVEADDPGISPPAAASSHVRLPAAATRRLRPAASAAPCLWSAAGAQARLRCTARSGARRLRPARRTSGQCETDADGVPYFITSAHSTIDWWNGDGKWRQYHEKRRRARAAGL